jgi:transposase
MHSVKERETALNLHFMEEKTAKEVSAEIGIPLNTIKSWIRRYRLDKDIIMRSNQYAHESEGAKLIKIERSYKKRESPDANSPEARIARLEMEVELLRNFLLEKEGRWTRK